MAFNFMSIDLGANKVRMYVSMNKGEAIYKPCMYIHATYLSLLVPMFNKDIWRNA